MAELLVRRLLAERVSRRLIQLVAVREFVAQAEAAGRPIVSSSCGPWDGGMLLAPLDFYPPFVDLPLWLLRLYQ